LLDAGSKAEPDRLRFGTTEKLLRRSANVRCGLRMKVVKLLRLKRKFFKFLSDFVV
jgi:hypothetical protein